MNYTKRFGLIALALVLCCATALLFARAVPARAREAFGPGDLDGDGVVTAGDARLALRCAVGLEDFAANDPTFLAGDLNGSKTITAADARLILRSAVDLEDPSAPSQPLSEIYSYAPDASDTAPASFRLEPDEVQDGKLTVKLYLCGAVGMKSADYTLTYDPAVLRFKREDLGQDAQQIKNTKSNSFTAEVNGNAAPGVTNAAFYFKTELTDAAAFAADSKYDDDPVSINAERFHCLTFTFELLDPTVKQADLTLRVKETGGIRVSSAANTRFSFVKTVASGDCGDDLTWTLDEEGTLIISGTGPMYDFSWGESPWFGSDAVKALIVKEGVTSVGNTSFLASENLKSVALPQSLTSIGDYAFQGTAVESITIPDAVLQIGKQAFLQCDKLSDVQFGSQLTSIGQSAFGQCTNLRSVYIPNSVKEIGEGAFHDCESLEEITLSDGMEELSRAMFWGCYKLSTVHLGSGIRSIGEIAFIACKSLTSIELSENVREIDPSAFEGCTGLKQYIVRNQNPSFCSVDGILFSKDKTQLLRYPAGKDLAAYSIPETTVIIGTDAFVGCVNLLKVNIPESVTEIQDYAFSGSSLETINVDSRNKAYASDANGVLFNKEKTVLIRYPESSPTADYDIPESVEQIEKSAFIDCVNLKTVAMHDNVKTIGEYAFSYCENMSAIRIGNGVTRIGPGAFSGCRRLSSIVIPHGVTDIGMEMFAGCESLTSISLPNGVTTVGDYAFSYCTSLSSIVIPNSVTVIGEYSFSNCTSLPSVSIPNNVKIIGIHTFEDCRGLTSVTIGNGVTSIENAAFGGCAGLTSITIPDSVRRIGVSAFAGCENLNDVYYTGNEAQFRQIEIHLENDPLLNAAIHYNFKPVQPYVPVIDTATMREANGALYAVAEQKAADLLAVAGEGATLTAADGTPAAPDAMLASGMVLTKADGTQETVIVKGDNDGDGRITASDARQALRAAVGLDTPNAWQQDACLVAGGETITAADARLILRAAVGLEESKSWLAA